MELSGGQPDGTARLTAGLIVTTWRTAYGEAIRVFERSGSAKKANATFEELIDRGFAAVRAVAKSQRRIIRSTSALARPRASD
jgi:hypothetical protein